MPESSKSVRRRTHLYETAKNLFETKGYDNTSVDQIVSAAGVAKGTFYYYFESKEDILQAMLEEIDGGWGILLDPVVDLAVCAAEKLRLCISILRRHYAEAPSPLLVYNDVADEMLRYKSVTHSIQALVPPFVQIIEQGIKEGSFRTQNPEGLAQMALTVGRVLLDNSIFPSCEESWQWRVETVQQMLERGLQMPVGSLDLVGDWQSAL